MAEGTLREILFRGEIMNRVFTDVSTDKKLFVDDERTPRFPGWTVVRTFHEAIMELETGQYREVSLDHDLGCFYGNKEMTGRDILNWLIQRKLEGLPVPEVVEVHSANPAGAITMSADIAKYWNNTRPLEELEGVDSSTKGC